MTANGAERKIARFKERPMRPGDPSIRIKGRLLIVGGKEDREGRKVILRRLAELAGSGRLVVATIASEEPEEMMAMYETIFRGLGVAHVWHLNIESREDASSVRAMRILEDATAVFFTGGDQLKITSRIGDTPVFSRIYEIFAQGGTIAGTSAGAAIMPETMIVGGGAEKSHRISADLHLAPGLGFITDVVVDQHFSERGRIGRLLGVVGQNPRMLGLGLDEDTAVEVRPHREFRVLGAGGVYVVDGSDIALSNVATEETNRTMSLFGVRLHVLSQGDTYDLATREPTNAPAEEVDEELGVEVGEEAGEEVGAGSEGDE